MVLVDLHGLPLTAWHVAARNITLTANSIKPWNIHDHNPTPQSVIDRSAQSPVTPTPTTVATATTATTTTTSTTKTGTLPSAYHHLVGPACLGQYPIESVILPLPGVCTPNDTVPSPLMTQMVQDGVSEILLEATHKDRLFRLPGAYRHLLTSAKNVRVVYDNEWCAVGDVGGISGAVDAIGSANEETVRRSNTDTLLGRPLVSIDQGIKTTNGAIEIMTGTAGEFPFVDRVEEMWNNGELLSLLADAGMEFMNAGKQPSSSSPSIRDDDQVDDEGSVVRVSFSLCASTYATTFLEHLRDVININTSEP